MSVTTLAPTERTHAVSTDDGVTLAVRETGPATADLTVVLLHGHCLRTDSWTFVGTQLTRSHRDIRVVAYDHRGHGASGTAAASTYTLERLAHDLHAVLDAVAPGGRVVLVGHSMGGMVALTYARLYPHEIGTRTVGVALVSSSAGGIADTGLGRLLHNPAVAWFQSAVRSAPGAMHRAKLLGCRVFAPAIRAIEFGDRRVSPRVLALAAAMRNETPIVTMAAFLSAFQTYDESATLSALDGVPTLVLCGSADLMTPISHSVAVAAEVAGAELVMVDGAGHAVILEQPQEVAAALSRLLRRIDVRYDEAA
ncbi:MAG TPA: alpha/beta hydrolase [Aldersonia sp.]